MLIGLHVGDFSWPGGPAAIGPTLDRLVTTADAVGVHSFWPMDHFFQIAVFGAEDDPMLEAYATLAWVAGRTRRLQLGALVTGVPYRHPGALVKAVTTLDVLSGGRAWLGLGAAWNEDEASGLGLPFPPLAERFERLEEVLVLARRMFAGDATPHEGRHYRLERPLNVPAPVRRPPVLVGGMGERKTLRLVARHADACNLFEMLGTDGLAHKLEVLRSHCDEVGRPYDDVVKTTFGQLGQTSLDEAVDRFGRLADLGIDLALVDVPHAADPGALDLIAELVTAVAPLGRPTPALLGPAPAAA
ncbi:MAG TPA: LLM class F420-dependent oxidoreductase [Acidimicrobiales bacterium]|nr:LLM class F420-dependent oxidoreductase [Acidimicrobiales bacterium]